MGFVDYAVDGAVGLVTINRPQALNALNSQVLDDLNEVIDNVNLDEIRALVITGAGDKSFVAGADIGEMSKLTKKEGEAFGKKGNDLFLKIETFPVPVIAAVNGFSLGGGNELAMSCDFRICSDNAMFGQPETGLGITPGFGGTQRLARLVGPGMAKQMIYTARNIKADEAYRIGLVNQICTIEELLPTAMKLASTIAGNAPIAVRNCKSAVNEGIQLSMSDAVRLEEELFGGCFESADQQEGMANFLRKKDDPAKVKHVAFQNK
ncbi:MAG: enoyl-CoA hydratase [Clostridiales bacterium]|nr:enoyl-CoA hydratase [Clostridiales bacterium]